MTRAHRIPITDLRAIARAELAHNPTIEVYEFEYGTEWRRPANPWLGARSALDKLGDACAAAGESMQALLAAFNTYPGGSHG